MQYKIQAIVTISIVKTVESGNEKHAKYMVKEGLKESFKEYSDKKIYIKGCVPDI